MSDWGMKVSKPGKDVKTCVDTDLSFSSKFGNLLIYKTGIAHVTVLAEQNLSNQWTYNHGLSYAPAYFIYVKRPMDGGDKIFADQ